MLSVKPSFKTEKYSQRITSQFRELRDQVLLQQKEQQKTQPTGKLIMLNYNDDFTLPGYYYRIKEILEGDEAAKERNRKLQEFDEQEKNYKNEYRLPDIFVERVFEELEAKAGDLEFQKIFWVQQAKLYQIEEQENEQVEKLVEDVFQSKEEALSLEENPPEEQIFMDDEMDKQLIKSVNTRKTSAFIEEEEGGETAGLTPDNKGEGTNAVPTMRKISKNSLKIGVNGEVIDEDQSNNSGYESEREELKNKVDEDLREHELAVQNYLDDDQLEDLLGIDSDEDIIFNEKDQIYFQNQNVSPFDNINRIYEKRESLHEEKMKFQKNFQKVIINAYKEKLKRKLYSKLEDFDEGEENSDQDQYFKLKNGNQNINQGNKRGQGLKININPNQNKIDIVQKKQINNRLEDMNADKQANLQKSQRKDSKQQDQQGLLQSKNKSDNLKNNDSDKRNSQQYNQDLINNLLGNQTNQEPNNNNIAQTFGLQQSNQRNNIVASFGNEQQKPKAQNSKVLLELLRDELKNQEGYISDDLMKSGISPQKYKQPNSSNKKKQLYGQFDNIDQQNGSQNSFDEEDNDDEEYEKQPNYFYTKQMQQNQKLKKQNYIDNLKETLKPKQQEIDQYDVSDSQAAFLESMRKNKEKRKAALQKSQKLQEERSNLFNKYDISEVNSKIYGCQDRISQLGLKSISNQKMNQNNNNSRQDLQVSTTPFTIGKSLQNNSQQQPISLSNNFSQMPNSQMNQNNNNNNNNFNNSNYSNNNMNNNNFSNKDNFQRQSQTSLPLNLSKLQSVNNQQAYQQQQQLYSYLDKQQNQQGQQQASQYKQQQNQGLAYNQQLISPESSFIQNSFMQQLPENMNTGRSNYSQFLYSARQEPNQQNSGSKNELESQEYQQYERACSLLYNDLKKILLVLKKEHAQKSDYRSQDLMDQNIKELDDIMTTAAKNNIHPNFLFLKLKIFRDEQKLKDHIDKMNYYNV